MVQYGLIWFNMEKNTKATMFDVENYGHAAYCWFTIGTIGFI